MADGEGPVTKIVQMGDLRIPVFALSHLREGRHDGLIDAFFEHSYVIVSVDDAQVETLAGAHDVIVDWATTGTIEEKEELRYPGLKPTGWVGYGIKTKAKHAWTYRRSGNGDDEHPWPSQEFREATLSVRDVLEEVCHTCFEAVTDSFGVDAGAMMEFMGDPRPLPSVADDGCAPVESFSATPLDFFYYYNTPEVAENVNCCEHADTGLISCIPCSNVPGLEIIDESQRVPGGPDPEYIDVEDFLEPHRDVVVFLGDTIQRITHDKGYRACWHRVAKNDKPRLSMVYKIRPAEDFQWSRVEPWMVEQTGHKWGVVAGRQDQE